MGINVFLTFWSKCAQGFVRFAAVLRAEVNPCAVQRNCRYRSRAAQVSEPLVLILALIGVSHNNPASFSPCNQPQTCLFSLLTSISPARHCLYFLHPHFFHYVFAFTLVTLDPSKIDIHRHRIEFWVSVLAIFRSLYVCLWMKWSGNEGWQQRSDSRRAFLCQTLLSQIVMIICSFVNMNDTKVLKMMMIMSVSVLTCWKLNVFVFGFGFAHVQTLHTVNEWLIHAHTPFLCHDLVL